MSCFQREAYPAWKVVRRFFRLPDDNVVRQLRLQRGAEFLCRNVRFGAEAGDLADGVHAGLERLSRHLHELREQADKNPEIREDPRVVKIVKKVQEVQAKFGDAEHDNDEEAE